MSLIITSSQDPSNIPQISISAPYQYRNDFKSGVKIPANSEIAVESVKLNRNPALDYEQGQVTLFWMGQRLTTNASLDDCMSWIIPSINRIDRNLSPSDFQENFLPIMKMAYSLHPEIDSNNITMTAIHNTTSVIHPFQGFRYNIPQVGLSPASVVPPSGTEEIIFGSGEWDGTTATATSADTYMQLQPTGSQGGPISLFNGEIQFQNFTGSQFTCGLMRPIYNNPTNAEYITSNPTLSHFAESGHNEGVGADEDQMYDYCAEVGEDNVLRLYHAVPDSEGSGKLVMSEIVYYQKTNNASAANNGDNSSFATGNPIPSASISDITFTIQNEQVIVSASGEIVVRANKTTSASFKDQVPKPLNQNCWKMYPTMGLWDNTDTMDINAYHCRTNSTMFNNILPNNWAFKSCIHADMDTVFTEALNPDTNEYVVNRPWTGAKNWSRTLDFRDVMKSFVNYENQSNPPHTSATMASYLKLNGSLMASYEPLIICGKSERYTQKIIQEWTPNSMNVLGFAPFAVAPLEDSTKSTTGQASFTSTTRPSMTSENSTFIRVPTLNHKTLNFGTGNPSKILFQVPRFDNSGAETGALFFQNPDKTYIDLNNPTDFTLTDLDVHFVRKDETFAKDLTGSSEVVFHIREKPKL
tara:strand:- start:1957 stop:3879 length:1923 start_codon:yes stop_codon:yes gene_type:complete